jgi:hypothetical protein
VTRFCARQAIEVRVAAINGTLQNTAANVAQAIERIIDKRM